MKRVLETSGDPLRGKKRAGSCMEKLFLWVTIRGGCGTRVGNTTQPPPTEKGGKTMEKRNHRQNKSTTKKTATKKATAGDGIHLYRGAPPPRQKRGRENKSQERKSITHSVLGDGEKNGQQHGRMMQ